MSITIRDEATAAELSAATEQQEVRAADGRVLGHFTPVHAPKMSCPELGLTDEELDRELNDPNAKWYTPEEVMARLREIEQVFALIWLEVALNKLADIYVAATLEERERIAAAVDALNARLRSDPLNEGEARFGEYRLTFVSLISVGFRVSTSNRVVRVGRVRRYGR